MKLTDLPARYRKQAQTQIGPLTEASRRLAVERTKEWEETFDHQLRNQGAHFPAWQRQYRFAPPRKWTFDFAWPDYHVAVEIDGGGWVQGRHHRPEGFARDAEKLNEAALLSWIVLRGTPEQVEDLALLRWLERALNPSRRAA